MELVVKIQERLEKWFLALSPGKKKAVCITACLLGILFIAVGSEVVWYFQNAEALAHRFSRTTSLPADFVLQRFWHIFTVASCLGGMAFFAYMLTRKEADSDNQDQ